jgi:2-desacetyl-2-hydroxyethyl bacteriochlorophyllide A dehydrogenase
MKTPAVVFPEPFSVELRDLMVPEVGPGRVGIRTVYSGVSQGTERWAFTGRYGHYDHDYSAYFPCSPGYQAAGVVDVVGPGVEGIVPGDHVFAPGTTFADPDHKYPGPCKASHSGYLVAAATDVTVVAPSVDLGAASLYHMAGVARHGVRLAGIRGGDLVAVIGLGMIGQMAAQAARRVGARVVGTDLIPARVELARAHSVDLAVDGAAGNLEEAVRSEAPGGADVVIDTTGVPAMVDRCRDLIRREGTVSLQGYYPDPLVFDFHATHLKRARVVFPCGWDDQFNGELADDMAAGRISIEPLITHRIPFRDAADAYRLAVEHPEASLGMVLDWADA